MVVDKRGRRGAVLVSAGVLLGGFNMVAVAHADQGATSSDAAEVGARAEAGAAGDVRGPVRRPDRPRSAAARATRPATPDRVGAVDDQLPARGDGNAVRRSTSQPPTAEDLHIAAVPDTAAEFAAASAVTVGSAVPPVAPEPAAANPVAPEGLSIPAVPDAPPSITPPAPVDPVAVPAPMVEASTPEPPILTTPVPVAAVDPGDVRAGESATPLPSPLAWTMLAAARNEVGRRIGDVAPAAGAVAAATGNPQPVAPVGQAVSPLGTPAQTAAEAMAMQTVRSLPVLAMKAVLGLAWRIIGDIEYAAVGGPDHENLAMLGDAVDEWAMASAFQSMILNSNDPSIVMQVAPPHRWYGQDVIGSRILYDNPDTIYRFAGVNFASQYVITGRLPEDDPKASFSVLTGLTGTTAAVLDADKLELGPDRTFVITVSGAPAQPGQSNHLQITPDTTLIAIRDTLSDWNTQSPMALAIQRVAGPPNSLFGQFGGFAIPGIGPLVAQSELLTALVSLIPPLPAVPRFLQGSITALLMLRGISEELTYIKVATTDPVTGNRKGPNTFTDPTSNASFLATQLQSAGYFHLADDQALVLTVRPNNAGYFVVPVTNDWTITENYWDDQTSLNNTQARSNPDGSYTFVVSPTEPNLVGGNSVWNWVSTGGLNQGTIAIRFQSIDPNNPATPTVSSQTVPLNQLGSVLPAGTVFVSPAERAAQIAARREGFNRRFAPYPQAGPV